MAIHFIAVAKDGGPHGVARQAEHTRRQCWLYPLALAERPQAVGLNCAAVAKAELFWLGGQAAMRRSTFRTSLDCFSVYGLDPASRAITSYHAAHILGRRARRYFCDRLPTLRRR